MPGLIQEFKVDLSNPDNATVRHFFILPNEHVTMRGRGHALAYYEESHEDLHGKVAILENHGFVAEITTGKVPKYQMMEHFVEMVLDF